MNAWLEAQRRAIAQLAVARAGLSRATAERLGYPVPNEEPTDQEETK